jgi:dephospho-CoA kinase
VVPPDRTWPGSAARLAARVARAAGPAALRVDHVGSTAVPGLAARDVVDLQLVVADLVVADGLREALAGAGFAEHEGESSDDDALPGSPRLLKRLYGACDPGRRVNLDVRQVDGPAWRGRLLFRDWLRTHDAERDAYGALKEASAMGGGVGIEQYMRATHPWIVAALGRAQAWGEASGWRPGSPDAGQLSS